MSAPIGSAAREDGFALAIVLMFVALIAAAVAPFALAARTERLVRSSIYGSERLTLLADGLTNILARRWSAGDGLGEAALDIAKNSKPVSCAAGNLSIGVKLQEHGGLIDLNAAETELLTLGFAMLGLSRAEASDAASAVESFRSPAAAGSLRSAADIRGGPKGGPFESASELSDFPALSDVPPESLAETFTVHARSGALVREWAPERLLPGLATREEDFALTDAGTTRSAAVTIEVSVEGAGGAVGYAGYVVLPTPDEWPGFRRAESLPRRERPTAGGNDQVSCDTLFGGQTAAILHEFAQ